MQIPLLLRKVKRSFITSKDLWPHIHRVLIIFHFRAIHYRSSKWALSEWSSLAVWYRLDTVAGRQPWGQKCVGSRWLLNSACQDDRWDTLAVQAFLVVALLLPAAKHGKGKVSRVSSWHFLKSCPASGAQSNLCSHAARWELQSRHSLINFGVFFLCRFFCGRKGTDKMFVYMRLIWPGSSLGLY